MSQVVVPDIGDFKEVEVIEVLVKPGDSVTKEQSLVTLESDKATMEIPSPTAGVVKKIKLKVGDKVSKGSPILVLDDKSNGEAPPEPKPQPAKTETQPAKAETPKAAGGSAVTVPVPDIGDFKEVEVIEVLVKPGDTVSKEQSLITLESDKATMEIPSPTAGVVQKIEIKVGDKVSKGAPILVLEAAGQQPARTEAAKPAAPPASTSAPNPAPTAGAQHASGAARAARRDGREAPRQPVGAQVRARARRRPRTRAGQRAEGPHPAYGRAGIRQRGALEGPNANQCEDRWGAAVQPAGLAGGGLRQVRPDRVQAARRASRSFPAPTCTATGSRFRTSRSSTRRTSPTSRPSARRRPSRPRRRASS